MKKRLRKKKHIGEFTEYGIEIRMINANKAMIVEDMDKFADNLLDYVESHKWVCGGGWSLKDCNFFIEIGKNMEEAEIAGQGFADFLALQKKSNPNIGYETGEIKISDAWHPDRALSNSPSSDDPLGFDVPSYS